MAVLAPVCAMAAAVAALVAVQGSGPWLRARQGRRSPGRLLAGAGAAALETSAWIPEQPVARAAVPAE